MARLRVTNRQGFRHDLARFRTKNFARREKNSKISVRNSPQIACNRTCRSMPTLGTVLRDLCGSWQGCAPPIERDFAAISRDFARKMLRPPRKNFKTFGPTRGEIRRATACQRSASRSGTSAACGKAQRHQSARISARSRAISDENFLRPRKKFKIFVPRFTANRVQPHLPQHADARHST